MKKILIVSVTAGNNLILAKRIGELFDLETEVITLEDYQLPNAEKFYSTTLSMPTFTFEDDALIEQYILAFEKVIIPSFSTF